MVALHAENGTVIDLLIKEALETGHTSPRYHALTRPAIMEGEATHRGIRLAELAEAPIYFVHVSSNQALKHIVTARDEGIPVFAETCPHYLLFDDSVYDSDDVAIAKYVMTPPLRTSDDQKHLWRALRYDDLPVIATDHCPFCMKEGHLGYRHAHDLHGNCDYTLLEGRALRGRVEKVFLRGTLIVDGPRWLGREGMGRFVPRGEVRAF